MSAWNPLPLSKIDTRRAEHVPLKQPALDKLFDGGPVRGASYLFSGPPGWGKSSWFLQFCQFVERSLYFTGEEAADAIKMRAKRFGIALPGLRVVESANIDLLAENITDEYDAIIIDSADRCLTGEVGGPPGSPGQKEACIALATDIARKLGVLVLISSHINAEGNASGKVANAHDVDGTIELYEVFGPKDPETGKRAKTNRRRMTITKHRHGEVPCTVECIMTKKGLDDFAIVAPERNREEES